MNSLQQVVLPHRVQAYQRRISLQPFATNTRLGLDLTEVSVGWTIAGTGGKLYTIKPGTMIQCTRLFDSISE